MTQNSLPKQRSLALPTGTSFVLFCKLLPGGSRTPPNHRKIAKKNKMIASSLHTLVHLLQHTFCICCLRRRVHGKYHSKNYRLELYLPSLRKVKSLTENPQIAWGCGDDTSQASSINQKLKSCTKVPGVELSIMFDPFFFFDAHVWKPCVATLGKHFGPIFLNAFLISWSAAYSPQTNQPTINLPRSRMIVLQNL